jgi:hypothetical protein
MFLLVYDIITYSPTWYRLMHVLQGLTLSLPYYPLPYDPFLMINARHWRNTVRLLLVTLPLISTYGDYWLVSLAVVESDDT